MKKIDREIFKNTAEYHRITKLQDLCKRDPEMYEKEVVEYILKFKEQYELIKLKFVSLFLLFFNFLDQPCERIEQINS